MASTNSTAESLQDSISPYIVHPSESPGIALVSPVLNGKNYHQWARAMKVSLNTKQKLPFIDGSILMPPKTDPMYPAWERANNIVISWINRSVSPSISQSILWIDKAYEVWEELEERFSQGNLFRIAELQESIANFRQGELSISDYFTQLKILWDELDNFRPPPKYTCIALPGIKKCRIEDKVIRFLKGLNDAYGSVISQIMLLEPLPNMSKVLSLVTQQEGHICGQEPDPKIMTVGGPWRRGGFSNRGTIPNRGFGRGSSSNSFGKGSWNKGSNGGKFCTHCKKNGHTSEVCYKLHVFPPNFQFTRGEQINSIKTDEDDANNPCKNEQQRNHERIEQEDTIHGLSHQQYQGLINMLQQGNSMKYASTHKENGTSGDTNNMISAASTSYDNMEPPGISVNSKMTWILDSGATDHI
ncbi:PREDICTED: uncharacterized protein LOC109356243 [Lupinus angustifolius]|uniref:uncharacterized protein LOC109356243 n=1 Tax=Lupinus angustifolius TaxID=3871 RepID=UPI00092EEB88|nr:PREDICTED: uncharacterized protein LOC109356243 [Lupinus angustifolius]